jgi:hypothetical protein
MENDCATAAAAGAILRRGVAWARGGAVILSSHVLPPIGVPCVQKSGARRNDFTALV